MNATDPVSPRFPSFLEKFILTVEAERFLLSVTTSTKNATPPGPYPSYLISMYSTPSSSPVPFLTALSIVSFAMFAAFALSIASLSLGLKSTFPPPIFAAIIISLPNLVKAFPLILSCRPFRCFIFTHLLCPATKFTSKIHYILFLILNFL